MTRSGWTGVLGIFVVINHVLGHWNSEVNLSRRRRLQEEESVNAKWQCEPQSEKVYACTPGAAVSCVYACARVMLYILPSARILGTIYPQQLVLLVLLVLLHLPQPAAVREGKLNM